MNFLKVHHIHLLVLLLSYYDILKEDDIKNRIDKLKEIAQENRFILKDIDIRKIKTYAPREFYMGIDITANKVPM